MQSISELTKKLNSILVEGNVGTFWHGSAHKITSFSNEFVDQGANELGPGIYFSSDRNDALGYAGEGGYLYECSINLRKELNTKTKINIPVLKKLMKITPDRDAWTNWAENEDEGIKLALQNTLEISDDMFDAIMNIWGDWYMQSEVALVKALVQIGFDGTVYPQVRGTDSTWVVVYNPESINVVKIHQV